MAYKKIKFEGFLNMKLLNNLVLALMIYLLSENVAYAYIDPGTGSYLFQLIAGCLIGIAIIFKQIVDFLKII